MIVLKAPFDEKSVRALKAGDAVAINGRIYTGRDKFHKFFADGGKLPVDFRDGALYHCGPVVVGDRVMAAGPTTSVRENPYEPDFIARSGVRLIIGTGGMDANTLAAMRKYGCVYIQAVGGAGTLYADAVKKVAGVSLLKEFGAAEAVWHFDVEDFRGVVAMDAHGNSLFENVSKSSASRLGKLTAAGKKLALVARGVVCALLLLTVGCRIVPLPDDSIDTVWFEFPFLNDYDVTNWTSFKWDDSFVTNSCDVYSQNLAGPMAAIAASTYGFRLFMDVRSMMDLGFPPERQMRCYGKDLSYKDKKYGRDRVGYTIASRNAETTGDDFDIVIIAIRGTFGRDEWISNFNLANEWGKSDDLDPEKMPMLHEGFSKATDSVMDALSDYVEKFEIDVSRARFLITGHSRGGSVANLLGKRLDDLSEKPDSSSLADIKRENVYVYCFAPPNVTIRPNDELHLKKYNNIFSIINPEDLVPRMPFTAWDGRRFGRELRLKCFETLPLTGSWTHPGYVGMKNNFKETCGYDYYHMILGTEILDDITGFAMNLCPTVRHYYWIMPEMRDEGKNISTHDWVELMLWKSMASADDASRNLSIAGDVATFAKTYNRYQYGIESKPAKNDHRLRFIRPHRTDESFDPSGRDFSEQPSFTDLTWQFSCSHAMQTYIAWMKSAADHGPDMVYDNWDEAKEWK